MSSSIVPNNTLVLRKVPIELNRVEKMREHFSQFGHLVDIKCQYDQIQDAALIQFANNSQALAAYKCPQPVFNNRFIRLYWFNNHQKQQQQQQQNQQQQQQQNPIQQQQQQQQQQQSMSQSSDEPVVKKHVKERLGLAPSAANSSKQFIASSAGSKSNEPLEKEERTISQENSNENQASTTTTNEIAKEENGQPKQVTSGDTKTKNQLTVNFNSLSLVNNDPSKLNATSKAILDAENQKKTLQLKQEVQKKARELIEQQIKDQKLLLQKYDQAKSTDEKAQILTLVRKLNESIEKEKTILKNNATALESSSAPTSSAGSTTTSLFKPSATPFSFQKHPKTTSLVLPAPPHALKLNNKRLNNTNFLKNTFMASGGKPLEKAAKTLSVPTPITIAPSAAASNPFSYAKIDNRPKQLLISGLENAQEKNSLVNFIKSLGIQIDSISDHIENSTESSSVDDNESATKELLSIVINFSTRKEAQIVS